VHIILNFCSWKKARKNC